MAITDRMTPGKFIEVDSADDGSITDAEGAASPVWTSYLGDVSCLIVESTGQRATGQELTEDLTFATLLFPAGTGVPRDKSFRIGAVDQWSGKTVYYYADAKPKYVLQGDPSRGEAYISVKARIGAIT